VNDKKKQEKGKKAVDHLTMRQVHQANPLASRYLDFARPILQIAQEGGHSKEECDLRFAATCWGFFYSECAKSSTGLAFSTSGRKAKASVPQEGKQDKKEGRVARQTDVVGPLAQTCARVWPTIHGQPAIGTGADTKNMDPLLNPVLDQLRHLEYTDILTKMAKKDRSALSKITATTLEDRRFLNSEEFKQRTKELVAADEFLKNPKEAMKVIPLRFPQDSFWHTRMTVTAYKQYQVLKKENLLLTEAHFRTVLRVLTILEAELKKPRPLDPDLQKKLKDGGVTDQDVSGRSTVPFWKGSRNLGRIHPRIVALQLREEGRVKDLEEWTEICQTPFFRATVTEYKTEGNANSRAGKEKEAEGTGVKVKGGAN
jgi:hypothetical protein